MPEVSVQPLDAERPEWGRVFVVPWDTDIFGFPVGTYEPGDARAVHAGREAFGRRFRDWAASRQVELVSCDRGGRRAGLADGPARAGVHMRGADPRPHVPSPGVRGGAPVASRAARDRRRPCPDRGDRGAHVPSRSVQCRSPVPAGPGRPPLSSLGPERVHLGEPGGPRVRRRQARQRQGLLPAEARRGPRRGRHHGGGRVRQGLAGRAGSHDGHAPRPERPSVSAGSRRRSRRATPASSTWSRTSAIGSGAPRRLFTGTRRMPGTSCHEGRSPDEIDQATQYQCVYRIVSRASKSVESTTTPANASRFSRASDHARNTGKAGST